MIDHLLPSLNCSSWLNCDNNGWHLAHSCHRFCLLSLHFFKRLRCSKMLPQFMQKLSTKLLGAQQVPWVSCLFEGNTLFCSSTSFKYFSLFLSGWILSRQQLQTTPCGECWKWNGKWAALLTLILKYNVG